MSLTASAKALFARGLAAHNSASVEYRRGNDAITGLTATVGKTNFTIDDGRGAVIEFESRDFLIPAANLVLDGTPIVPQRGDKIIETDGNSTRTYEVLAQGGEPCFKYDGPCRDILRIHTKQVAAAS